MIPANHITINGDTAWWVFDHGLQLIDLAAADVPCDGCFNGEYPIWDHNDVEVECPDCDGTGRHTFAIEVECVGTLMPNDHGGLTCDGGCSDYPYGVVTHRVHVVPSMVVPIVDVWGDHESAPRNGRVVDLGNQGHAWVVDITSKADWQLQPVERITLPPAAKPGMWAVQLAVHQ